MYHKHFTSMQSFNIYFENVVVYIACTGISLPNVTTRVLKCMLSHVTFSATVLS